MPKKGWKNIAIKDDLFKTMNILRGNLSYSDFLRKVFDDVQRLHEKIAIHQTRDQPLTEKYPCLSRYEDEGFFWCWIRKAYVRKLSTLKICSVCHDRLTTQKALREGLMLTTRMYPACGAKEYQDRKKGLMLYCRRFYGGQWVTLEQCKTAKCRDLKEVKTT